MARIKRFPGVFALLAAFVFLMAACPAIRAEALPDTAAEPAVIDTYDAANPQNLAPENLTAKAAIVVDADSGITLFEKNADRQTYPASTTKIMTCLIALENSQPGDIVTIPQEAVNIPWDSSKTPVSPGEQITMIDLLHGMMMKSGNDAALAVAIHVGGSVSDFVDMMNARAEEMGCKNTHFVNPHGYHEEEHVSTARDLALIATEAMKNPTFREIVASKTYTMAPTSQREKLRLETSNSMFVASSDYYDPYLIGVKTGFHSKAGYCFVGAEARNGANLISVALKTDRPGRWKDTLRLMNYADTRFQTYSFADLFAQSPVYVSVRGASRTDPDAGLLRLSIVPGDAIGGYSLRCLPEQLEARVADFTSRLQVNCAQINAPVYEGDILGTISLETSGGVLSGTVVASRDVAEEKTPFTLENILPGFGGVAPILLGALLLIVLLVVVFKVRAARRDRRRRKELERRRRAALERYRSERYR